MSVRGQVLKRKICESHEMNLHGVEFPFILSGKKVYKTKFENGKTMCRIARDDNIVKDTVIIILSLFDKTWTERWIALDEIINIEHVRLL